jgi:hypothetical protein
MPREFTAGDVEEGVALVVVLADEDDVGRVAVLREPSVAPPPAEQGVVAQEFLEVLVDSAGAVVLDQKRTGSARAARCFDDRIRSNERGRASRMPLMSRSSSRRSGWRS